MEQNKIHLWKKFFYTILYFTIPFLVSTLLHLFGHIYINLSQFLTPLSVGILVVFLSSVTIFFLFFLWFKNKSPLLFLLLSFVFGLVLYMATSPVRDGVQIAPCTIDIDNDPLNGCQDQ